MKVGNLKVELEGGEEAFEGIRNKRKTQIFVACRIGHNNPNNNYMIMMMIGWGRMPVEYLSLY